VIAGQKNGQAFEGQGHAAGDVIECWRSEHVQRRSGKNGARPISKCDGSNLQDAPRMGSMWRCRA